MKKNTRLWLLYAALLLVTAAQAVGILAIARHAHYSTHAVTTLSRVEALANRMDALRWQALAEGNVEQDVRAQIEAARGEMPALLLELASAGSPAPGVNSIGPAYSRYLGAADEELRALEVGNTPGAGALDESTTDAAFRELSEALVAARNIYHREADRGLRTQQTSTVLLLMLAALVSAVLFTQALKAEKAVQSTLAAQQILLDRGRTAEMMRLTLEQRVAERTAELAESNRLLQISREQLQYLAHQLVNAQECERQAIARELHDEAGQGLTALTVGLRLLEKEVGEGAVTALSRIGQLKEIANGVSEGLHRLAANLRPASLDRLGLVPALRQHIELFNRQNEIRAEFVAVGLENRRLPPVVETALYRVVQETLTNAARHARPTRVGVIVERRAGHVIAVIEDDGVGFDPEVALHRGRLGLVGMRERAEALGGSLKIESGLGTGTTVFVQIPVEGQPYSMARISEHMYGHQLTETDRATGEVPYGKDSKSDCTAEH